MIVRWLLLFLPFRGSGGLISANDLCARHSREAHEPRSRQHICDQHELLPSGHVNERIFHRCIPNRLLSKQRLHKAGRVFHKQHQPVGWIHSIRPRMMTGIRSHPERQSFPILIVFSSVYVFISISLLTNKYRNGLKDFQDLNLDETTSSLFPGVYL